MEFIVGVDNGHGENTAGKRSPDGSLREWQFNYATAKYLKKELERCGIKVVMLSDTASDTALSVRVSRADNAGVHLVVSIHANAYKGTVWGTWGGIETFAFKAGGTGDKYAKAIQENLIASSRLNDRGVKYDNLYMTRETKAPAVLVECGFMDNKKECDLLKSDAYRKQCARDIAKAICSVRGIKYVPEKMVDATRKTMFRVVAGSFEDRANAEAMKKKLESLNIKGVFLEAKEVNV